MSIEDDVLLLERVPTLRLLGNTALRMLAIGSEQRDVPRGDHLFKQGEDADSGFVVQRGAFRIDDGAGADGVVGCLVDQDECAAVAIVGVAVGDDDRAGPQCYGANIVERQLNWAVELVERFWV